MRPLIVPIIGLAALCVFPSFLQIREKKKTAPDFHGAVKQAVKAYDSGRFGECIKQLGLANRIAAEGRRKLIMAAMPEAPQGFVKIKARKRSVEERDMMAAMAHTVVGQAMEMRYRRQDGKGRIEVSIMAGSPLVRMLSMQFAMARMDPKLEVIGYGSHKGLLKKGGKKNGGNLDLSIIIAETHLVQISATGIGADDLLKMFNQAFVDKLAGVL